MRLPALLSCDSFAPALSLLFQAAEDFEQNLHVVHGSFDAAIVNVDAEYEYDGVEYKIEHCAYQRKQPSTKEVKGIKREV